MSAAHHAVAPPRHAAPRRSAADARLRWLAAVDVAARLGSAVTFAALLVVAAAIGGAADGVPAEAPATAVSGTR